MGGCTQRMLQLAMVRQVIVRQVMVRLLGCMAMMVALTACHTQAPEVLTFAVAQAPINLDPRFASDAASERVNRLIYQRLVEFDQASRPTPGLADWHMLTPQHVRIHLKAAPRDFHDGQPLTMHDVKATYQSIIDAVDSPHHSEFSHIARMEVLDAHTLDVHLNRPDPDFAARLIIGILPARRIAAGHDFSHHPLGNGAFRFKAWQQVLVLERIQDGLTVQWLEVKDPNVRVLKLKRGEVDLLQGDLPPELVHYLEAQSEVAVRTTEGANYSYLGLNTQAPFLKDPRVRRAIAHAIDTRSITSQLMVRHSRPATAILPPEHYAGNPQLSPYAYQPALAKQLLKEAGVALPLRIIYKTSTDAQRVRLATVLQAQMLQAGIDLQIKSLDWGTFYADVQSGNFQLYGLTWVGIQTPEIYSKVFGAQQTPPQGLNRGGYQDAVLEPLLAAHDWPAVTERIHTQLPYIPLWYEGQFAAFGKRVQQYLPAADGNWDGLIQVKWVHDHA